MALPNRDSGLWCKLVDLPLDRLAEQPAPQIGFAGRLMREQGWDYGTTVRAIAEYRRFILLAYEGEASPSRMVDEVWHLHLTYTQAYNEGLCKRTLGRALDHTPSGGAADTLRYEALYEQTLKRYRQMFGEQPPASIWPPAKVHFALAHVARRRKPRNTWIGFVAVALAIAWMLKPGVLMFAALVIAALGASAVYAYDSSRRKKDGSGCGSGDCGCGGGDGGGCSGGSCGGGCGGGGCG
jgi:hypothetical protein